MIRTSLRTAVLACCLVAVTAGARGKSKMIEFKTMPSTPKAMAAALEKEKPGSFRDSVLWGLETKVRDLGTELSEPDEVNASVKALLARVFEEMAAPTDLFVWEGDTGLRGDVLVKGEVKIFPGRTTTGFGESFTVTPKGKKIDRGYLNQPLTVKVSTAASAADWYDWTDNKGWGAWVHPVKRLDGVVRVAISLFSPGRDGARAPAHERPVWVGFLHEDKDKALALVGFAPPTAKEQRGQESNLLRSDKKLNDVQRRHQLALRIEDVRAINPARTAFLGREAYWFALDGRTTSPIELRNASWLDPWKTDENPMVRAAVVLKAQALGADVATVELLDVLKSIRIAAVQRQALEGLNKRLDAKGSTPMETEREALAKLGGGEDVKTVGDVARVRAQGKDVFFVKGASGWAPLKPAQ